MSLNPLDVVKSRLKDRSYVQLLRDQVFDLFLDVFGARLATKWRNVLDISSDALYILLCVNLSSKHTTLGEESAGLFSPSAHPLVRAVSLFLCRSGSKLIPSHLLSHPLIQLTGASLNIASSVHTLVLLSGHSNFPTLADVVLRAPVAPQNSKHVVDAANPLQNVLLTIVFVAVLARIAFSIPSLLQSLDNVYRTYFTDAKEILDMCEEESEPVEETSEAQANCMKCSLCLESINSPACTSCGHVFCWKCLVHAIKESRVCPLCRTPQSLHDIICIHNLC